MPIYEYDCPACGRLFERRVPMSDADHTTCPHCGGKHPKRRLSRINVKGQSTGAGANLSFSPSGGT